MLKLYYKYLAKYKFYALATPILVLLSVVGDLLLPTLMSRIIDKGLLGDGGVPYILSTGGLMIGCAFLCMLCAVLNGFCGARASLGFASELREDLFNKIQTFSFTNIDKFKTGSLITRLTNDVIVMQGLLTSCIHMLIRGPIMLIGSAAMAVILNPRMSLILFSLIPIVAILVYAVLSKNFPRFRMMQDKVDRVNTVTQENVSGARVVKAYVRADHENARFSAANEDLTDNAIKAMSRMALMFPGITMLLGIGTAAALFFGAREVAGGTMEVGKIMAFVQYMGQSLFMITMSGMMFMQFSRAKAAADRINEVMRTNSDILDGELDPEIEDGSVEFRNVTFRYAGQGITGDPVLKNVNLTIRSGETVGILGSTGSGKTSLISLIPRLYDPTEGEVLVGGHDVREYTLERLRNSIAMVLQESVLFSGTIADNIRWGREEATDEEIHQALEDAQAAEFVDLMEKGIHSDVEQRGLNFSGGQKQRLSIARALVKQPNILILDDSTSAVDMGTEANIQQALRKHKGKMTVIIIAQRISSVMEADHIVVMENGEIASYGTHDELIRTSDIYRDIVSSQTGQEVS
ncbi:MAG: ABC transporter ATP-binding protein [Clostridia bacterium]|nr:ABC transporter ATP-binding protein [Clostridia bacterium]